MEKRKRQVAKYRRKWDLHGNITNRTFGKYKATGRTKTNQLGRLEWEFKCVCGNILWCTKYDFRALMDDYPYIQPNCGCFTKTYLEKRIKEVSTNKKDRLYRVYIDMFKRLENTDNRLYRQERGAYICKEWLTESTGYPKFVEWAYRTGGYIEEDPDTTPEEEMLTIVRKDKHNLIYSPENCTFAEVYDPKAKSKMDPDHHIFFNGVIFTFQEFMKYLKVTQEEFNICMENPELFPKLIYNIYHPYNKVLVENTGDVDLDENGYIHIIPKYNFTIID